MLVLSVIYSHSFSSQGSSTIDKTIRTHSKSFKKKPVSKNTKKKSKCSNKKYMPTKFTHSYSAQDTNKPKLRSSSEEPSTSTNKNVKKRRTVSLITMPKIRTSNLSAVKRKSSLNKSDNSEEQFNGNAFHNSTTSTDNKNGLNHNRNVENDRNTSDYTEGELFKSSGDGMESPAVEEYLSSEMDADFSHENEKKRNSRLKSQVIT